MNGEKGMSKNRKRSNRMVFYLDESELALLKEKMTVANIQNREAYIRKMVLDGYVLKLDFSDVRHMNFLLSNATKNLNQVARHANQTGEVKDIQILRQDYEKLWDFSRVMMKKFLKL